MKYMYIYAIVLFVLGFLIKILNDINKKNNNDNNIIKYLIKKNPMTDTEIKFVKELKKITDINNLIILPQVQLQSIFYTINNKDITSFNKIKCKSIDFAIVDSDYNYKLFIELDDYTHNRKNRIQRDQFINELFKTYNLKLKRIKVQNNYNIENLKNIIKEVV